MFGQIEYIFKGKKFLANTKNIIINNIIIIIISNNNIYFVLLFNTAMIEYNWAFGYVVFSFKMLLLFFIYLFIFSHRAETETESAWISVFTTRWRHPSRGRYLRLPVPN